MDEMQLIISYIVHVMLNKLHSFRENLIHL